MWLALSLAGPESQAGTRAQKNTDYETTINRLVVYITEKGKKDIVSVGFPLNYPSTWTEEIKDVDLVHDGNGVYEALMPLSHRLTPGKEYDLHVAANLTEQDNILAAVWATNTDEISGLTVAHSGITEWKSATMRAGSNYIPMSSATPVEFKIEDKDYPRTDPIKTNGTTTAPLSITLTRLFARVDFKDASPATTAANTYEVENNNQILVTFTSMKPMNIASTSFLAYQASSGQVNNPSSKTLFDNASAFPMATTPVDEEGYVSQFYLTENTPAKTNATFKNLTYVELTAKVTPTDKCPTELKNVLQGKDKNGNATTVHPALWYYDDGTFQSTLMLTAPENTSDPNWHKVEYKTDAYYLPPYRKAIRHGGVEGATTDAEDGVIDLMEYGIVRNHVYQVSIAKVASLPHPWTDTDYPEDGKSDLKVQVKVPEGWDAYHRGAFEVEY